MGVQLGIKKVLVNRDQLSQTRFVLNCLDPITKTLPVHQGRIWESGIGRVFTHDYLRQGFNLFYRISTYSSQRVLLILVEKYFVP